MNNLGLAEQCFSQAARLCPSDPLVANELGVLAYRNRQYEVAAGWLRRALSLVPGGRPTPSECRRCGAAAGAEGEPQRLHGSFSAYAFVRPCHALVCPSHIVIQTPSRCCCCRRLGGHPCEPGAHAAQAAAVGRRHRVLPAGAGPQAGPGALPAWRHLPTARPFFCKALQAARLVALLHACEACFPHCPRRLPLAAHMCVRAAGHVQRSGVCSPPQGGLQRRH